jgi:hypothetical protein
MMRHVRLKHGSVLTKPNKSKTATRQLPDAKTLRMEWAIALGQDMRPFSLGECEGIRHFLGLLRYALGWRLFQFQPSLSLHGDTGFTHLFVYD